VRLVRGRVALIPWVLFLVACLLTAFGTFTPAAVAILAPIGMNFAYRYKLNPLVVGMMVISGGHAGAFSPLAVSGALMLGLVDKTELQVSAVTLFSASFLINLVLSARTYVLLAKRPVPTAQGSEEAAEDEDLAVSGRPDWRQWLILACLAALVIGALGFHMEIGFLALAAGALLALVDMKRQEKAVDGVSWSTLLLVAGMMTYIAMLEKAGIIETISEHAAGLGTPVAVALLLCFTVAVTSAFASSTAILTAIIPIAVPLLLSSHLSAAGLIAALAVSTTIVDTSPFSTNGALVLGNARGVDPRRFYRQVIGYTGGIVALGPVVAWGVLVLPWS
jgi:di/tricarboxylate transporter